MAPDRPVPVMVTVVPPPLVPVVGLTLVTAAGMDHVKLVELLAPLISSAVTSTVNRPEVVGTPEMSPLDGSMDGPDGSPSALKVSVWAGVTSEASMVSDANWWRSVV